MGKEKKLGGPVRELGYPSGQGHLPDGLANLEAWLELASLSSGMACKQIRWIGFSPPNRLVFRRS